jgi:hypothetical protein
MTILRCEKVTNAQAPPGMEITSLRGGNYCVRLVEKLAPRIGPDLIRWHPAVFDRTLES